MATAQKDTTFPQPLTKTGVIDQFEFEETTTAIGREYPKLNLVDDVLNTSNADELLRDLAITSKSYNGLYTTPLQ